METAPSAQRLSENAKRLDVGLRHVEAHEIGGRLAHAEDIAWGKHDLFAERSLRHLSRVSPVRQSAPEVEAAAWQRPGADAKPFELAELEARVRALTRRSAGTTPTIQCGPLSYDQVGRVAQIDGQNLDLSAREIGLLEVLLNRMGRLVSKDQLVDHLCGWGEEVSHNAIEVYVHRLRKKLEVGGVKIATVRGLGYCLERPQAE